MDLTFNPPGCPKEKMLQTNTRGMELSNHFFNLFKNEHTEDFQVLIEMLYNRIIKKYGTDLVKIIIKNGEQLLGINTPISEAKYGELTLAMYIKDFEKVPIDDVNVLVNQIMEKYKMFLHKKWINPRTRDSEISKLFEEQGFFQHSHVQNSYMIVEGKKFFTNSQFLPMFVSLQNVESKFMIHRLRSLFLKGVPSSIVSIIVMSPEDPHYTISCEYPHIKHQLQVNETREPELISIYTQSRKASVEGIYNYLTPNLLILSPEKRDDLIKRASLLSSICDSKDYKVWTHI